MASGAQDGLWFLHRLAPESPAYVTCRVYHVTGRLDVDALRAAWFEVVRRHDSLRTRFVECDGRLTRTLGGERPDMLRVVDAARSPSVASQVDALCAEPIDFARGPLVRLTVIRVGPRDHRLVLLAHQAVVDSRSVSILVNELSAAYAGTLAWRPAPAPYSDYVAWQRSAVTPALVDWWTDALAAVPPTLELPADRARPAGPSVYGGVVWFDWGEELSRRMAELGTPEVVLLAAFQALLGRYTGEDRVAVGFPASVRPSTWDNTVGAFENLLVVCTELAGPPTFRDLVDRVAERVRDGLDHRALPFADLVRALRVDRDPRRIPLCDVMFAVEEEPESSLDLTGATVRRHAVSLGGTRTDLTLTVDRLAPSVMGSLEFRASLFDRTSAERMLEQLRTLLTVALDKPDLPVAELPLDSADQARAAVRAADRISAAAPADRPVHELVHSFGRRRPETVAVSWAGAEMTYRELSERAVAVATALRGLEGVDGSAVAVRMSPGPRQIAALVGVLEAGAHLVWLGTADAGDRGRAVLADLRPVCLVLDGEPAGDGLAEWYRDELHGLILRDDLVPGSAAGSTAAPADPASRAYVAYTSGSTGRPKGIPQTHAALSQFVTWLAGEFGIGPGSRVAQWVAPEHDPAICEVFATLVSGGTLYPVPERIRRNPERIVDWLTHERITVLQTVPSFAREVWRVVAARDATPPLDRLLLMGEALPGELVNGLRGALPWVRLANLYGPTETIAATWHDITEPVSGTVPIGLPMPGRQVIVVDEQDRPCPAGVTGEIVVRSPYVTPGYLGDGGGDAPFRALAGLGEFGDEYAVPLRTYRTGDLGRWRWDGALEFRGRKDFQVKLLGNRLELSDIEAALAEHDSVLECAVVALTDRDGLATQLVAYVVPRAGAGPDGGSDVWRAHLRRRFGRSMLPLSFRTMTTRLPRNVGGKVDRRRLPHPGPVGQLGRPLQTPAERRIAAIWSELLDVDDLAADTNFFAAGGHSLLIPQLVGRIRERFGVDVSLWEFFANPTPSGLSTVISSTPAPSTKERL